MANWLSKCSKLITLFVLVSFLSSIGAHLVVVQSIAWVKMSYRFSQESSVKLALRKTFDGKHPCELCKRMKRANSGESEKLFSPYPSEPNDLYFKGVKKVAAPVLMPSAFSFAKVMHWNSRALAPPIPPPRLLISA